MLYLSSVLIDEKDNNVPQVNNQMNNTGGVNSGSQQIGIELNKASGFIRKQLSKSIHLKRLPSIRFTYDDTAERSERIESILKSDLKI